MAIVHHKAGLTFEDQQRSTRKSQFYYHPAGWDPTIPDTAIADAMAELATTATPLFQAVSAGTLREIMVSECRGFGGFTITGSGKYPYASDKLSFDVLREDGGVSVLDYACAPKDSIFTAGSEAVNLADANVAGLVALVEGGKMFDIAGNKLKKVLRGYRTGTPMKAIQPGGH